MDISKILQSALQNHKSGNFCRAEQAYKEILSVQPNNFYALHSLGVLYLQLRNYDLAFFYIEKALQVNPSDSHAFYNLGISLQGTEKVDEAIISYEKAIELNPDNADAYVNLGLLLKEKGRADEAMNQFQEALNRNPRLVAAYNNLGTILKTKGQFDDAIACYHSALQLQPNSAEILSNLGTAMHDRGQFEEAIAFYEKAIQFDPSSARIRLTLGIALMEQGRQLDALAVFENILAGNEQRIEAHLAHCIAQLPIVYQDKQSILDARKKYYEELICLRDSLVLENLTDKESASQAVGLVQPFYLAYQGMNDRRLQQSYGDLVCRIMTSQYPQFAERPAMPAVLRNHPLKIGFVSGHFFNHSVWKVPIKGWMENLDRQRFKLYGYYTWNKKDEETACARSYCVYYREGLQSFDAFCADIRKDELHVLIYPELGMDPLSLKLASLRLAPVQCVSWGHPTTSGLPTIDYYLSSDLMEPHGAEEHYSEKLIRLPNLSAFIMPVELMHTNETRDTLHLRSDAVVYHCCQSLFKYLPQYDEVFPRIALETGNCQFLFSSYPKSNLPTEQFRARIGNAFRKFNLNADEFVVMLPFLDVNKYNALYHIADIFLDPIGWSGCNSALEAISCNLPIVTLPGAFMRSRDCFAILALMHVQETIASSLDEYVRIAVKLGKDPTWRRYISDKISANKDLIYYDTKCITALEQFFEDAAKGRL